MFEDLLSILPFNPGLVHQLGFYGKRMRAEKSIRRLGFLFILLAFAVQFFAVLSPSQPTLAASTNDLLNGGFSSAAEAASFCRSNISGYKTILSTYGVTCDRVASANTITIRSTDFNRQLYSMGRLPYGIAGETPINVAGSTLYVRYLWGWDTGAFSSYRALNVTSPGGQTILLLYACGNLTTVGLPIPITPPVVPAPVPVPVPVPTPTPTPAPVVTKVVPQPKAVVTPVPTYVQPTTVVTALAQPKTCQYDTSILASSSACVPCEYNQSVTASDSLCKPCAASLSSQDLIACVNVHKTAANLTQGLADANNTTAQPNDVILYTLYANNKGLGTVTGYTFQEQLSSVLDYADAQNLYGGTLASNGQVSWPAVTIKPGATATEQLSVKVKSVIPQTPTSTSDPEHFNLTMINVYGNSISIKVPASPIKIIETATTTQLPNTGPGSSLFISAALVMIVGYFFARSRLLAKEINLAVQDAVNGGL